MMATVDVLNQMAEYDFNAPIAVEMIFEDSDDDDPSIQSALTEQDNMNDSNKQVPVEKSAKKTIQTDNKQCENQTNHRNLDRSMLSLNKNSRVLQRKSSIDSEKAIININKNAETRNNETVNNEEGSLSTSQTNDNHEPVTTFIEDLLNKLSEHIVLIMQSFYHYGVKRNNVDNKKREDVFNFIKYHFFELSYSTIESIFLPQEQNESFINQFLDNTVQIANNKAFRWKCHRGHVLPFFTELMTLAKQKKDSYKTNPPPCQSNGNILLKQQLVRPLLPLNLPQSKIIATSNIATQNIQNNLCIFSSGPPGSEISINIDTNTLMQLNERQHSTVTPEQNGSKNNNVQTFESSRRKNPIPSKTNRNLVKDIQKRNPQYHRPPPPRPAPHISHCTNTIHYRPQQNSQINMNPIRHHYDNMGPPHQIHQNIGQPINNYPTQVHYINTNYTSPPHSGSFNHLYNNTNNDISMHPTPTETQYTSGPVITSVTSLDPKARMYNARCYMCGKRTPTPCYPYNPPCRQVYCSYLCQELDSQSYKPAWGNT